MRWHLGSFSKNKTIVVDLGLCGPKRTNRAAVRSQPEDTPALSRAEIGEVIAFLRTLTDACRDGWYVSAQCRSHEWQHVAVGRNAEGGSVLDRVSGLDPGIDSTV